MNFKVENKKSDVVSILNVSELFMFDSSHEDTRMSVFIRVPDREGAEMACVPKTKESKFFYGVSLVNGDVIAVDRKSVEEGTVYMAVPSSAVPGIMFSRGLPVIGLGE